MEKILKLYTYVDGTNDTPFPSSDEQIIIGSFTYTANRMGSSPAISATVKHRLCLDDYWNDKVYAEFNGEKYFVINTPSSSKSNDDTRYEHELELLSEREVLNHVYFIDAVQGDSDVDQYKSNSTKVQFYGNLEQFVGRLNASLSYRNLGYTAVIDDGISTADKNVTFEDKYILEALQEEFNAFEIPYYFVGKKIHFGYTANTITTPFKYGYDSALLSISKDNANYALINRITGTGSSDNIPYYYPNNSPKGDLGIKIISGNMVKSNFIITDYEKFSNSMSLTDVCKCASVSDGGITSFKWSIGDKDILLSDIGIKLAENAMPQNGASFGQEVLSYITPSQNLMPSIYRETGGAERFYNAKNNTYTDDGGGYYEFENEYSDSNPREGITDFDDIKPTIVGVTNAAGHRIDSFIDFAYDTNDNDEVDEEGNYLHPYFFAKLRKTDGSYGFNLFDQAIENQAMQISFTSGVCGACTFEIAVGEETQKNLVQVGESGALMRDENGNVLCGRKDLQQPQTPQERQNDTQNYEVWIALRKDYTTYPQVMPNVNYNYKPSTSDTFVILGINLPQAYILKAEDDLEKSLIKYMWMNNVEKFTFSAKFSRIFFEENPEVLEELNENSQVIIEYNGQYNSLYVNSYTYKMDSGSPLPEIEIELIDNLTVGNNSLQTQLDRIKDEILSSIGTSIILKDLLDVFLRKDINDTAHGIIRFDRNIGSSAYISGWLGIGWDINGAGQAEFDSLRVRHDIFLGDRIGSASFVSGFPNGTGWQIGVYEKVNAAGVAEKKYKLEIDDVSVRGSLRAYEFIISQMRGENDNYIFAGMMKVDHYDPETRRIYLDTEEGILYNPFRSGDIIMVQRYGGMPTEENDYNIIKQYELCIDEAGIGSLSDGRSRLDWITFTNFTGDLDDIVQGDILVRVDSVSDSTRKGVVTVTTINETGAPYIDVVYGMKTDPENATKARMGNLTGICTKNGVDLTGVWGIYGNGAYFENTTIVLDNGNTVEQQFSVLNGRLESIITEIDSDMSLEDGNILVNSSFSKNTDYWVTDNEVSLYSLDGAFLWDGDTFMSEKGDVADIYQDGSRYVLRIRNSSIKQLNSVMDIPVHSDTDEEDEEYTYSFSLYYRALSSGTLSVGMEGTGLYLSQQVEPSDEYARLYKSGVWNEEGDFVISCTGEVLIYAVSLFTDELANAVIRLQTQITQNAEEISLRATKEYVDSETGALYETFRSEISVQAGRITANTTKIDNINDTIETAGWITTAEGNTLYAAKSLENGNNIVSYINQSATSIKISASRVNLTGAVTMSMLNSSLQNTINNAASDAEDALSQASTAYSQAQSAYNRANSAYTLADNAYDRGDSAYSRATTAINNAASALNAANAAQQDINDMPEWSKEASIIKALEDATIIVGGYIAASYIDTDNLVAKRIESATGSFRSLDCVDNSGNKMGNITFDTGGRIWFNSCDLQHQGTMNGRTLRFLSADIWCRGQFAAKGRITARVLTNTVYYYHSGTSSSYSRYTMSSKSYNGHTYYTVPCYGESIISGLPTGISGIPIDTIVFKMAGIYYYELDLMTTQRVFVYNGNDSTSTHIFINGTDKEVSGGMGLIVQQMPSGTTWMNPSIGSVPGAYQLISGEYDNNWRQLIKT